MSNPHIQLSDHFTYPRLLRFVAPSITMMIFTSIYGVVDGFFVSNYVGKTPFAALNFIMPFIMCSAARASCSARAAARWLPRRWAAATRREPTAFSP